MGSALVQRVGEVNCQVTKTRVEGEERCQPGAIDHALGKVGPATACDGKIQHDEAVGALDLERMRQAAADHRPLRAGDFAGRAADLHVHRPGDRQNDLMVVVMRVQRRRFGVGPGRERWTALVGHAALIACASSTRDGFGVRAACFDKLRTRTPYLLRFPKAALQIRRTGHVREQAGETSKRLAARGTSQNTAALPLTAELSLGCRYRRKVPTADEWRSRATRVSPALHRTAAGPRPRVRPPLPTRATLC